MCARRGLPFDFELKTLFLTSAMISLNSAVIFFLPHAEVQILQDWVLRAGSIFFFLLGANFPPQNVQKSEMSIDREPWTAIPVKNIEQYTKSVGNFDFKSNGCTNSLIAIDLQLRAPAREALSSTFRARSGAGRVRTLRGVCPPRRSRSGRFPIGQSQRRARFSSKGRFHYRGLCSVHILY